MRRLVLVVASLLGISGLDGALAQNAPKGIGVPGMMYPQAGVFRPLPPERSEATATSTFNGTVNSSVTATVSPALAGTNKIYCQMHITITGDDPTTYKSYYQYKTATSQATLSGSIATCKLTTKYRATFPTTMTLRRLSISYDLTAIDQSIPAISHEYGVQTKSLGGDEGGETITLPADGVTLNRTVNLVL